MDWSNWIYLGTGLALGAGVRTLFVRSKPTLEQPLVSKVFQNQETELSQQIKQTQLAYHLAQQMSQFKAGFLARTTHVLRSPLNGLIGLHQLILSDLCESPEEEREFIEQAHERALKLLKLIDEILNVARAEYGTNRLDIQPILLSELLQEVYDLTYMLAENRNFPFQLNLPESEIYILTDCRWLRQVLINLIETTIGEMETQMEEGRINVSAPSTANGDNAYIWLDIPTSAFPCSEPIDLMTTEVKSNPTKSELIATSRGMDFLLNQTILEVLGCKLEIIPYPDNNEFENLTRLQISVPLAICETKLCE